MRKCLTVFRLDSKNAKVCKSCTSRQELSNEYLLFSIYSQFLASIQPSFRERARLVCPLSVYSPDFYFSSYNRSPRCRFRRTSPRRRKSSWSSSRRFRKPRSRPKSSISDQGRSTHIVRLLSNEKKELWNVSCMIKIGASTIFSFTMQGRGISVQFFFSSLLLNFDSDSKIVQ